MVRFLNNNLCKIFTGQRLLKINMAISLYLNNEIREKTFAKHIKTGIAHPEKGMNSMIFPLHFFIKV